LKWSSLSLVIGALGLCLAQAHAQLPTNVATPGGIMPSSLPTPSQANGSTTSGIQGRGMIGQIGRQHPQSMQILVGREIVDIPSRDCLQVVTQALAKHAVVPVSDPRCANAIKHAIELQMTRPES
jgi:hypothetical protein